MTVLKTTLITVA